MDAIVDEAAALARAGGPGDAGVNVASGARGDIHMALPTGTIVADVSIIHPAATTYLDKAAATTGAAAALRDAHKVDKYRDSPLGGACDFVPLSVETYGRMGAPAMELLGQLADLAAESRRVVKAVWMRSALQKLSVALVRGNAWQFKAGLAVAVRVTGKVVQTGLAQPALSER